MSGFVFRLERLLKLRSQEELAKARELADALREEEAHRRRIEEADAHLESCREQIADGTSGVAPAGMLHNLGLAVDHAARRLDEAVEGHRDSERTVLGAREEFGEARMERRVIERLREKRHESWTRENSRREQMTCDEVARDGRRSRGDQP